MTAEPRIKNAVTTRESILLAARRLFAAESFEAVGMRHVARKAGVNVALVSRYFGSKENLFRKVLFERGDEPWFGGASSVPELASWLGDLALSGGADGHQADLERLYIILRSASSPATAGMISEAFVEGVFDPLATLLDAPDGQIRAGLALILVIGTTVLNGVLSVQAISEELREKGRRRLVALIAQALAET